MFFPLLAILLLAGPTPARLPGDPEPPQLPAVAAREPAVPAPLPIEKKPEPRELTSRDLRRMAIGPTASLLTGIATPLALASPSGDWGTPATQLLARYGRGDAGISAPRSPTGN